MEHPQASHSRPVPSATRSRRANLARAGWLVDDGRLMVLIAFNNDVSDSWQWADDPRYPGELANLGLQIGVNIAMYALTH